MVEPCRASFASPAAIELPPHAHPAHPHLWLDYLPRELRETIAQIATHGISNLTALRLANSSPIQRESVIAVIGHRITADEDHIDEWAALLGQDARHVNLQPRSGHHVPLQDNFMHLFSAPRLRVLEICDHPDHLTAALELPVRTVIIDACGQAPPCLLIAALPRIVAEDLRLKFGFPDAWTSWRLDPWEPILRSNVLADCSNLTSLTVASSMNRLSCGASVWAAVMNAPSLRHLVVSARGTSTFVSVSSRIMQHLARLQTVTLQMPVSCLCFAARLGKPVTEIDCTFRVGLSSKSDLLSLTRCTRLKRLRTIVEPGVEHVLAETIKAMPELELLHLTWDWTKPQWTGSYAQANSGKLLSAIRVAPKLARLSLTNVRISIDELTNILQALGTRLRSFTTSLCDQDEAPLQRLTAICKALADHNLSLEKFQTLDHKLSYPGENEDAKFCRRIGRIAIQMLGCLERRVPMLSTQEMIKRVRGWMENGVWSYEE